MDALLPRLILTTPLELNGSGLGVGGRGATNCVEIVCQRVVISTLMVRIMASLEIMRAEQCTWHEERKSLISS